MMAFLNFLLRLFNTVDRISYRNRRDRQRGR